MSKEGAKKRLEPSELTLEVFLKQTLPFIASSALKVASLFEGGVI